jgi:hypothetical protein
VLRTIVHRIPLRDLLSGERGLWQFRSLSCSFTPRAESTGVTVHTIIAYLWALVVEIYTLILFLIFFVYLNAVPVRILL